MARPSKYKDDTIEKAEAYLAGGFKKQNDAIIPSIAGLALYLGVTRETVRDWGHQEEKAEFSAILAKILSKQEEMTLNGALSGTYNATIAKLLLGKHGYSEKHEQAHTGADGGSIKTDNKWTVEFVNATPES